MVIPLVVEDGAVAEGAVGVGQLEDLDADAVVEGQAHWEVLLAADLAEDGFF